MNAALTNRIVNLIFAVCCVAVVGLGVARYRTPAAPVHAAREDILKRGIADPFALPASDDGRPVACIFISSNCPVCSDSMPFYKRLSDRAAPTTGPARLLFVSMEGPDELRAYLRASGIVNTPVASTLRPLGIPGTPSVVLLDRNRRVARSWAGRLSPRQEQDIESLVAAK